MRRRVSWLREDLAFLVDRVGYRAFCAWYDLCNRRRALRRGRWRCALLGCKSERGNVLLCDLRSFYCGRCGEMLL